MKPLPAVGQCVPVVYLQRPFGAFPARPHAPPPSALPDTLPAARPSPQLSPALLGLGFLARLPVRCQRGICDRGAECFVLGTRPGSPHSHPTARSVTGPVSLSWLLLSGPTVPSVPDKYLLN